MTDKELLELAAKAAGYVITNWDYEDLYHGWMPVRRIDNENGWETTGWNPLTDDGDALRLAVKLHMDLILMAWRAEANTDDKIAVEPVVNGDPYAATRRAITRAAAEIGKAMKS
jgi:hypothetical protein